MARLRNLGPPGGLSSWHQSNQCSSSLGSTFVSRRGSAPSSGWSKEALWCLISLPIVHSGSVPACLLHQHNRSPSVHRTQPSPRQCRHLLFLPQVAYQVFHISSEESWSMHFSLSTYASNDILVLFMSGAVFPA